MYEIKAIQSHSKRFKYCGWFNDNYWTCALSKCPCIQQLFKYVGSLFLFHFISFFFSMNILCELSLVKPIIWNIAHQFVMYNILVINVTVASTAFHNKTKAYITIKTYQIWPKQMYSNHVLLGFCWFYPLNYRLDWYFFSSFHRIFMQGKLKYVFIKLFIIYGKRLAAILLRYPTLTKWF